MARTAVAAISFLFRAVAKYNIELIIVDTCDGIRQRENDDVTVQLLLIMHYMGVCILCYHNHIVADEFRIDFFLYYITFRYIA